VSQATTDVMFPLSPGDIGVSRDGCVVGLHPIALSTAVALGRQCAAIDPWQRYGISASRLTSSFAAQGDGGFRYELTVDHVTAGALIILQPWLIGPYVQFIAVLPAFQRRGVGQVVLDWVEARARGGRQRNLWLCVTAFNDDARAFYAARGWKQAAVLPDLVADHVAELLMRKRLI
jgi:ribosomal protein S18 acetylase RimI-like enzyme